MNDEVSEEMFVFLLIFSLVSDDCVCAYPLECEYLLVDVLHAFDADPVLGRALLDLELDLVLHEPLLVVIHDPLLLRPNVLVLRLAQQNLSVFLNGPNLLCAHLRDVKDHLLLALLRFIVVHQPIKIYNYIIDFLIN